ncbi:MAG: carbohydrate ABC transporter permease [Acholeplasmataceae bacterium]|nr:carbohydrate ABC transporter permease [Acholeplasmataceae bacterium]
MTDKKTTDVIKNIHKNLPRILSFLTMMIITVLVLYPIIFVFITSIREYAFIVSNPFGINGIRLENYVDAWARSRFSQYFVNSVIVASLAVVAHVFFVAIFSFAIGTLQFKGSKFVLFAMLSTMFITGEVTSVPMFLLFRELDFLNTLYALIIPAMFGVDAVGVLLGSNHLRKIPRELREAAIIDGASIPRIFWSIDLPLLKPILGLVAILVFQGVWSDFLWPLITVIGNQAAYTLPLGLINFQSQNNAAFGVLSAGLVILTVPILLVYIVFSKQFIKGVGAGAVKG